MLLSVCHFFFGFNMYLYKFYRYFSPFDNLLYMDLTWAGSAVGFRLDSLLKLTDTRATNNRMTLMHYLCKV